MYVVGVPPAGVHVRLTVVPFADPTTPGAVGAAEHPPPTLRIASFDGRCPGTVRGFDPDVIQAGPTPLAANDVLIAGDTLAGSRPQRRASLDENELGRRRSLARATSG